MDCVEPMQTKIHQRSAARGRSTTKKSLELMGGSLDGQSVCVLPVPTLADVRFVQCCNRRIIPIAPPALKFQAGTRAIGRKLEGPSKSVLTGKL